RARRQPARPIDRNEQDPTLDGGTPPDTASAGRPSSEVVDMRSNNTPGATGATSESLAARVVQRRTDALTDGASSGNVTRYHCLDVIRSRQPSVPARICVWRSD